MLADVFPKARFICLYRHPMDFIASAVETCRWGFQSYGLYPYIAGTPGNFVFGLAKAWCERVSIMVALEARYPRRCLRVTYEDLVTDPTVVFTETCHFLSVPYEEQAVASAVGTEHLMGYGDHKIFISDEVSTDSLGRGSVVPVHMLTPPGFTNMNMLLDQLGYEQLSEDWGSHPSPLRRGLMGSERQQRLWDHVITALQVGLTAASYELGRC
jgi:protein-tyrosine sulfotransferase